MNEQERSMYDEIVNYAFLLKMSWQGPEELIKWCMKIGLMASEYECSKCGKGMKLLIHRDQIDGYVWRCKSTAHVVKRSVRKGSWLGATKMEVFKLLSMTYFWVQKCSGLFIVNEVGVSQTALTEWEKHCREVCVQVVKAESEAIGGIDVIVELDERQFVKPTIKGCKKTIGKWVFGGVERNSGKCFFKVVTEQSQTELYDVIQSYILPGTTVVSDCWKTYDCVDDEEFVELQVKNNLNLETPNRNLHINTIRSMWGVIMKRLDSHYVRDHLDSYLAEYVYRKKQKSLGVKNLFLKYLDDAKKFFPPATKDKEQPNSEYFQDRDTRHNKISNNSEN